jgi:hypothetical protein
MTTHFHPQLGHEAAAPGITHDNQDHSANGGTVKHSYKSEDLVAWLLTRFAQPYIHTYSVCPFVSFTHYLFLLEEDCLQEDMALTSSSLCMSSLLTVE